MFPNWRLLTQLLAHELASRFPALFTTDDDAVQQMIFGLLKANPVLLGSADERLQGDRHLLRTLILEGKVHVLMHALPRFAADAELIWEAVERNGMALEYASAELRGDRDLVSAAVAQRGVALKFASYELRGDADIVMQAVWQDGFALEYARSAMRASRDIVVAAVSTHWQALEFASEARYIVGGLPEQRS